MRHYINYVRVHFRQHMLYIGLFLSVGFWLSLIFRCYIFTIVLLVLVGIWSVFWDIRWWD
jgi:hypothetical protein